MAAYFVRRLTGIVPSLLLLVLLVIVLVRLIPGTTVDVMLQDFRASQLDRHALEHRLGLDRSVPDEFGRYVTGLLHGDLGQSLWNRQPVRQAIFQKLPVTTELALLAGVFGAVTGIALGVLSGVRQGSLLDYGLRSTAILFLSVPNFVLGSAIVLVPAIYWGWAPPLHYHAVTADPLANVKQFILPALVLGLPLSAALMRLTRTTMLEVLRQDYVRTARAKGLSRARVVLRHTLRNALIPVVTLLGLQMALLLSGSVIVESLFGLPGLGQLVLDSLSQRDYPVIEGITVVLGIMVMLVNLYVDFSYVVFDPRIRLGSSAK
jgi:peptide/nickel transport system permease protein